MVANDIVADMSEDENQPTEVSAEPAPEAPPVEVLAPLEADGSLMGPVTSSAKNPPAEATALETPPPAEPVAAEVNPEPSSQSQPSAPTQTVVSPNQSKENSLKATAQRKQKVEAHLEKILAHARLPAATSTAQAGAKKTISNKEVVMLLKISDATASRYLKMLMSRGQLKREGRGRSVVYTI